MRLKIGITTLNRKTDSRSAEYRQNKNAQNYVYQTLSNLFRKANLPNTRSLEVKVFDSGSSDLSYLDSVKKDFPFVEIIYSPLGRLTLVENTDRALLWASEKTDWAIIMQDDVDFVQNSWSGIQSWIQAAPHDAAVLTLWNPVLGDQRNYILVPPEKFWSNVFVIFRSTEARHFLFWEERRKKGISHDLLIGEWAQRFNKKIYSNPYGWVNHIGIYSSLGDRDPRFHQEFRG